MSNAPHAERSYGPTDYVPPRVKLQQAMAELRERELATVSEKLEGDVPSLFALADKVVPMYRRHRHGVIFTDAVGGMNVGRFLGHILKEEARRLGADPPRLVDLANSRRPHGPLLTRVQSKIFGLHTAALIKHATRHKSGAERALIVTDTVSTGRSLRRLDAVMRKAGMTPDYAILRTPHEEGELARRIQAGDDSEICAVRVEKRALDLHLRKPEVRDSGHFAVVNDPVPRLALSEQVGIHAIRLGAIEDFYAGAADEYIRTRMDQTGPSPTP